jgi:hypothetical protein
MQAQARRRIAVFVVPLVVGLVMARQAASHLRSVDFLLVFACGAIFGVGLMGLFQTLRGPMKPER